MKLERDAVDRLGHSIAGAELYLQLIDLEQQAVDRLPQASAVEDLDIGLSTTPDGDCHACLLSEVSDRGRPEQRRPA